MIKSSVFVLILFLVISTSLVKNSTKDVEDQIYSIQENILFLENRNPINRTDSQIEDIKVIIEF